MKLYNDTFIAKNYRNSQAIYYYDELQIISNVIEIQKKM